VAEPVRLWIFLVSNRPMKRSQRAAGLAVKYGEEKKMLCDQGFFANIAIQV
jgi:hypothetical protein